MNFIKMIRVARRILAAIVPATIAQTNPLRADPSSSSPAHTGLHASSPPNSNSRSPPPSYRLIPVRFTSSRVGNWVSWSKARPPTENVLAAQRMPGCPLSPALKKARIARKKLMV